MSLEIAEDKAGRESSILNLGSFSMNTCGEFQMVYDAASEFERLLGHTALRLWPDLPRDMQELFFEAAVPTNPVIRNRLAVFRHDRHPRTAHPPEPIEWV